MCYTVYSNRMSLEKSIVFRCLSAKEEAMRMRFRKEDSFYLLLGLVSLQTVIHLYLLFDPMEYLDKFLLICAGLTVLVALYSYRHNMKKERAVYHFIFVILVFLMNLKILFK